MADRTTKLLLAVIAAVLSAILFRLLLPETPAQAQSGAPAIISAPLMAVDSNIVYILQNGRLSAYYLDSAQMRSLLPQVAKQRLRHLDTITLGDQR